MKEQPKRGPGRPRERISDKPLGRRVAELRHKGLSFSEVGEKLGIHKQHAHQVYKRVMAELAEVE